MGVNIGKEQLELIAHRTIQDADADLDDAIDFEEFKKVHIGNILVFRSESSLICKEECRFSMGWCMREPYCPLSSAVRNATIPTLPLFEMAANLHVRRSVTFYIIFCL